MKQRFQELATQSGISVYTTINTIATDKADLEKFAELIVKELITICTPDISGRLDGRPYETADDFDRGFIDGQDCCVELIKQHFGVEE